MKRNAFEALCILAGREKWCWNIGCTTCGCMHFRHALRLLAKGRNPQEPGWPVRKNREIPESLGELPGQLEPGEQEALVSVLAGANLEFIARRVKFPDWLGHLGLALYMTREQEGRTGTVTAVLAPQLARMCGDAARAQLESMVAENQRLSWQALSGVEHAIERRWQTTAETIERRLSDAPAALRSLSDLEKAQALARALEHVASKPFECEIESVRYDAVDRVREFNWPTEIRVRVRAGDGGDCAVLQESDPETLAESIAHALGKAVREDCRARIVSTRYGRPYAAQGEVRMTVLVARDPA